MDQSLPTNSMNLDSSSREKVVLGFSSHTIDLVILLVFHCEINIFNFYKNIIYEIFCNVFL
jgi:hypothetical protein